MDAVGCHYQICVLCGRAYEYNWTMMCRTSRLMVMDVQHGRPAGYFLPGTDLILRRQKNSELVMAEPRSTHRLTDAGGITGEKSPLHQRFPITGGNAKDAVTSPS